MCTTSQLSAFYADQYKQCQVPIYTFRIMCDKKSKIHPEPDPKVLDALKYLMQMYRNIHTDERRNTLSGHWINEAFVVRLWAVLEAHHCVYEIDQSIKGWKAVDICRRLRNEIAHATGETTSRKAKRLQKEINDYFERDGQESIFKDRFILSKDTVLRPMHKDCTKYCKEILSM